MCVIPLDCLDWYKSLLHTANMHQHKVCSVIKTIITTLGDANIIVGVLSIACVKLLFFGHVALLQIDNLLTFGNCVIILHLYSCNSQCGVVDRVMD